MSAGERRPGPPFGSGPQAPKDRFRMLLRTLWARGSLERGFLPSPSPLNAFEPERQVPVTDAMHRCGASEKHPCVLHEQGLGKLSAGPGWET